MKQNEAPQFALDSFKGPLDLLVHLVQKEEIDIHAVELQKITTQFKELLEDLSLEISSEFIHSAGYLVWLKSRTLLPLPPVIEDDLPSEEPDPRFEIIHHLIDYCRFKEAAKRLTEREEEQNDYFPRGSEHPQLQKPMGVEHLSLEDLASLFSNVLSKASAGQRLIEEEAWILSDMIGKVQNTLQLHQKILFTVLFSMEKVREELIVTFLAILELMKGGKVRLVRDKTTQEVYITSYGS